MESSDEMMVDQHMDLILHNYLEKPQEQEQGEIAANPDGLSRGGDGGGGGGDCGDCDCCPGELSGVDYKVEELDLGNASCLNCSVNAEDKRTG
ncbi:hypothetical protein ABZP36_017775 [Zizania latifolia]